MSDTWEAINEALGGIPDLGGANAKCVGRSDLFDVDNPADGRAEAARNICGSLDVPHCPALAACSSWFASLPKGHRRPAGTVAGKTYQQPKLAPPRVRGDEGRVSNCISPKSPPKPRIDAAQWLAARLADGPVLAADVVAAGKVAGFSAKTLDRARRAIGATSTRLPGRRRGSKWALDSDSARVGGAQGDEQPSGAA